MRMFVHILSALVGVVVVAGPVAASPPAGSSQPALRDAVVLLHGLGRSAWAMKPLAADLAEAGFDVCNLDYPSRSASPEELVAEIAEGIDACGADTAPRMNFVGHSLGGILARAYVAENRPANLGRVVMLAPPNRGNEYVDLFVGSDVLRWLLGPTGAELGTDEKSLPHRLPQPTYELGVIAGTWSMNPFAGFVLDGAHDGLVTVESTKLAGMTDFLTVNRSHTFIMRADEVAAAVIHFLRHGRFEK